jgi:hypothetical protein
MMDRYDINDSRSVSTQAPDHGVALLAVRMAHGDLWCRLRVSLEAIRGLFHRGPLSFSRLQALEAKSRLSAMSNVTSCLTRVSIPLHETSAYARTCLTALSSPAPSHP